MLTCLDFIAQKQPWPPGCEKERLSTYEANRKLFKGKHEQVFQDWVRLIRDDKQAALQIILNWPKRLSTLWADLLLGEPPIISAGDELEADQVVLDRIIEQNGLINVLYEIALDVSRFGVGLAKVRSDSKRRKVIISGQNPSLWFPVVSPEDLKDIAFHVLAWTYDKLTPTFYDKDKKTTYLKMEIHERGRVTYREHILKDGIIEAQIGTDVIIEFPLDSFLLIPINNLLTTDSIVGMDDYGDLESLIQEMEVRMSQISRILDKHADPSMYGPETALQFDPSTGQYTFKGGGRYFAMAAEDATPGYLVWDGRLESAFTEMDLLMTQFFTLSETSAAAFGDLKSGLAESGSALKRLMLAPLAKTNRIRMRFDPALKELLKLASLLEVIVQIPDAKALTQISITWQDGLPLDIKEQSDVEVSLKTAGLTSTESSIARLFGLSGKALEEEMEKIEDEKPEPPTPPDSFGDGIKPPILVPPVETGGK